MAGKSYLSSKKKKGVFLFLPEQKRRWTPPVRTTYAPLWRRLFVNERSRDTKEQRALFDALRDRYETEWTDEDRKQVLHEIAERLSYSQAYDALTMCVVGLIRAESVFWCPEAPENLRAHEDFLNNKDSWRSEFIDVVSSFFEYLSSFGDVPSGMFRVPLHSVMPTETIDDTINVFARSPRCFSLLADTFDRNIRDVHGIAPHAEITKTPKGAKALGMTTEEGMRAFLCDTPFSQLFQVSIQIGVPFALNFEHTHVLGGSGSGKTSFLAQLTLEHLRHPERPSIIIVDSQDSLIPQVRRLAEIQSRLTYIDPRNPPSINLFEGGGAFDTYRYLFSSILDMELTGKQETFFKFVVRLLQEVPNATIKDLVHITSTLDRYQSYIALLPEAHQQFFREDYAMAYRDTRSQVRTRLQGIYADETLSALLSGARTDLDIAEVLNGGGVLLVDTSKDVLGGASSAFGKVFIFLIMKAIYGRKERHPTFLLVDEAFEYFSSTIDDMLNQMRKFRCGCVFAHHNLTQATPELRASLASSTSIKLASRLTASDARVMASEMHTTPEFITNLPSLHFALYARDVTQQAIRVEVTPGVLDHEPSVEILEITRKPLLAPDPQNIDVIDEKPSETW